MGGKRESFYHRVLRVNNTVPSERLKDFDFSDEELRFYFKLHTHRYWTTTQMKKETGVVKSTIYRYIQKMENAGLLEMGSTLGPKQTRTLRWRRKYDEVRIRPWGVCWVKPVGDR